MGANAFFGLAHEPPSEKRTCVQNRFEFSTLGPHGLSPKKACVGACDCGHLAAAMERGGEKEPRPRARRESGLEMLKAARDASRRSSERRTAMRAEALGSQAMRIEGDGMWRGESWAARWRRRAI